MSSGAYDVHVGMLNADGSVGWAKSFGSSSGDDFGQNIVVDSSGYFYALGSYLVRPSLQVPID